jgi:site-specific recombinase XerD
VIEKFKKYLIYKEHMSTTTINTYTSSIKEFINWYNEYEDTELLKVDNKIIDRYNSYLILVKKNKVQTVKCKNCALSIFNKFLCYKNAPKNYITRTMMKKGVNF